MWSIISHLEKETSTGTTTSESSWSSSWIGDIHMRFQITWYMEKIRLKEWWNISFYLETQMEYQFLLGDWKDWVSSLLIESFKGYYDCEEWKNEFID